MLIEIWEYTSDLAFRKLKQVDFNPTDVGQSASIVPEYAANHDFTITATCTRYSRDDASGDFTRFVRFSVSWGRDPEFAFYQPTGVPFPHWSYQSNTKDPSVVDETEGTYGDGIAVADLDGPLDGYWVRLGDVRWHPWNSWSGAEYHEDSLGRYDGDVRKSLRCVRFFTVRLRRRIEYVLPPEITDIVASSRALPQYTVKGKPVTILDSPYNFQPDIPVVESPSWTGWHVALDNLHFEEDRGFAFVGWALSYRVRQLKFEDDEIDKQLVEEARHVQIPADAITVIKRDTIVRIPLADSEGDFHPLIFFRPVIRFTRGLLMRGVAERHVSEPDKECLINASFRLVHDR